MTTKCLIIDSDEQAIATVQQVIKKVRPLDLIELCKSADKIMDTLTVANADFVFIDPHMKGMNGKLEKIENILRQVANVIVMSSSRDAAKDAFDIDAKDFLLKPLKINRVVRSLGKVTGNGSLAKGSREGNPFFVKDKSVLVRVETQDIFMIEALADYVNIYTAKKKYTVHTTMKKMEALLGDREFVRVHKSFIVRIDAITEVENNKLTVEGHPVPVSNTYRKDLMEKLQVI